MKIKNPFFNRDALILAQNLLGKKLVRKIGERKITGIIVETEAYVGPKDKASHAYKWKRTKRNEVEYLSGGYIYIYLCYGIHWQLNIVASKKGIPECVLIRALELPEKTKNASGPGKLCKWLKLDGSFNKEDITKSKRIWIEDGPKPNIVSAKRVGIDYAGIWAKKLLRFYIKNNQFISRK